MGRWKGFATLWNARPRALGSATAILVYNGGKSLGVAYRAESVAYRAV